MKLYKLFLLMLALPLALVACDKNVETGDDAKYLYDVKMTEAERITGSTDEDETPAENQFMLLFTNEDKGCELTLFIQGEESETALSAGTYKSTHGALVLDKCLFVSEDKATYTFQGGEGIVEVRLSESKVYEVEATLTDAKGNKFHATYNGAIANMTEEENYDESTLLIDKAQRLLPAEKFEISEGDIGILFETTNVLQYLAMVFTLEKGEDILTTGTYSTELGNLKVDEGFYINSSGGNICQLISGEVTVQLDGDTNDYDFDMLFTDTDGKTHHFIYTGQVMRMVTTFEDAEFYAWCFGLYYGLTYNYYIWIGENIMQSDATNKHRFVVDLYAVKGEKDSDGYYKIPNGTYQLDTKNSMEEGTFSAMLSCYEFGPYIEFYFEEGTFVVTDDGATLTVKDGDDVVYTVVYNGAVKAIEDDETFVE